MVGVSELADTGAGPAGGRDRPGEAWLASAAEYDLAALEPALTLARDTGTTAGLDMRSRPLLTIEEIAGVLMALLPIVGTARVTVAASAIRTALDQA